MRTEKESAAKVQGWWRKSHENKTRMMERAREIAEWDGLAKISLHNEELMQKLKSLRTQKAYEEEKIKKLLNMPARDVNAFLESEARKPQWEKITEEEKFRKQHIDLKSNEAAFILQKFFRSVQARKASQSYLRRCTIIKPQRRIELLEEINQRLTIGTIRRFSVAHVQQKLDEHKNDRPYIADQFAKLEVSNREFGTSAKVKSGSLESAGRTSRVAQQKAKRRHEQQLMDIEDSDFLF